MKTFNCNDPATQPQLALPAYAILCIVKHYLGKNTPWATALADLITIAFSFLLCLGKNAMPTSRSKTSTVQFCCQDVRFFQNGTVVLHSAPLAILRQANSVRLYIDNQKNGQRGSTMHHTTTVNHFCPVKALANRGHSLYRIAPQDASLPISYVPNASHVTAPNITWAICESAVLSGLLNSRYSPTLSLPYHFMQMALWHSSSTGSITTSS
jgi:hypothetical protein